MINDKNHMLLMNKKVREIKISFFFFFGSHEDRFYKHLKNFPYIVTNSKNAFDIKQLCSTNHDKINIFCHGISILT